MRILVLGHREDETVFFQQANNYGYEIDYTSEILTKDYYKMTRGYDALVIGVQSRIDEEAAKALKENGVRYLLTRAAGRDHLDQKAIEEAGLHSAYVPRYSPGSVAEYTVMTILELLRKSQLQKNRIHQRDFRIVGLRGRELRTQTVGVIGNGKIGEQVIKILSGFGCRILIYQRHENPHTKGMADTVSLNTLIRESDIITLHCPLTEENYHMIDQKVIASMKEGAILVNTARGGLIDTQAMLEAVESGKLAGCGMDVYEFESSYKRKAYGNEPIGNALLERLLNDERILFTAHTAFYTEEAVSCMIATALRNLHDFEERGFCENDTSLQ